jgi:hypothetical protein
LLRDCPPDPPFAVFLAVFLRALLLPLAVADRVPFAPARAPFDVPFDAPLDPFTLGTFAPPVPLEDFAFTVPFAPFVPLAISCSGSTV